MTSPVYNDPAPALSGPKACLWWSKSERRCRDADVEVIGAWDPRPAPQDWGTTYYGSGPADWGAYPTEKRGEP